MDTQEQLAPKRSNPNQNQGLHDIEVFGWSSVVVTTMDGQNFTIEERSVFVDRDPVTVKREDLIDTLNPRWAGFTSAIENYLYRVDEAMVDYHKWMDAQDLPAAVERYHEDVGNIPVQKVAKWIRDPNVSAGEKLRELIQ